MKRDDINFIISKGIYVYVQNKNKEFVSDYGKCLLIDENNTVHFSRYEHRKACGETGEHIGMMDCFLRLELPITDAEFYVFKDLSPKWKDLDMELISTLTIEELANHIRRKRKWSFSDLLHKMGINY